MTAQDVSPNAIIAEDRAVLRELARPLAEIAALPEQQETIRLWKALNGLRPERPMVSIDQIPWHEINVNDELTLRCRGQFARRIETQLRRTLYSWRHMRADMVVEPVVETGKVFLNQSFGYEVEENTSTLDPAGGVRGHLYIDQVKTDEDIQRIAAPETTLDEQATAEREAALRETFDGLLGVRMSGITPWFRLWDILAMWHSVEACLMDLAMRPDFIHRLMRRFTDAHMQWLDRLEERGYLVAEMRIVHCAGAWVDELPAPGFDPARPRAKDLWTAGMAQVFSSVSPAMHKEFEIDYAIPWYDRFGLGYYGCCEPLDAKLDVVKLLPNLRKVSMSPWTDRERGAEGLGPDYVFSNKPAPWLIGGDTCDQAVIEADLRQTRDACDRHGCPLEFILKDISTVRYEPQRLWDWVDTAMRVARG